MLANMNVEEKKELLKKGIDSFTEEELSSAAVTMFSQYVLNSGVIREFIDTAVDYGFEKVHNALEVHEALSRKGMTTDEMIAYISGYDVDEDRKGAL